MPKIKSLLQEHSTDIVREQLRKIVEIYDPEWIVVHELVQNAIDAIQTNLNITEGKIDVIIDIDNDIVTVTDNGTGFTADEKLLCPGGSGTEKRLASRSPTKGYQGVGLKAVMYSTTMFEIESQTEKKHWTFLAENLIDYIDLEKKHEPEYDLELRENITESTYTIVKASFPKNTLSDVFSELNRFLSEDSVRWQDLYREEKTKHATDPTDKYLEHFFSWYFRTQSYVGCANRLLNTPVMNVVTNKLEEVKPLKVILQLKSEAQFVGVDGLIGRWLKQLGKKDFAVEIPNRAWDYSEIVKENQQRSSRYQITPKLVEIKPNHQDWETLKVAFRNSFLDIKLTPDHSKEDFYEIYDDFIAILERPRSNVRAKDFQDVLERITGIYLAIGRTADFELLGISNHGIRVIASNGISTDHDLSVVSTSSTWYLETIHMVINVDETLNLGKRHLVNPRLVRRIRDFFEACYPKLVNISKLFVERDTNSSVADPLPDVIELEKLRRKKVPFRRFPEDESTLIGMFSSVLTLLDENFAVYSYFGRARYDGKFRWVPNEPRSDAELLKLEFKVQLEALISEFEQAVNDKEFSDLDLIIVWDRRITTQGWHVKGISRQRQNALEQRGVPTDIVEFVLEDQYGQYRPLICVADLLLKIDLVDEETDDLATFVEELR